MKKLLIVTTIAPSLRGFFANFAYHFRAKGWRVDGMAQGASECPTCVSAFDRVWEVEWSRNPLDLKNLITAPQQIREALDQEHYDLVEVSTPVAAFVTRSTIQSLPKHKRPKVIYTAQGFHFYRGGSPIKNAIFLGLEKLAGAWTDYLVLVNREDEEAAKQYRLVSSDRIRHIPGTGLKLDRFNPDAISTADVEQVRQDLGLSPEMSLFLSVAEFIPRKRSCDILQAFARLARPDLHLAFAGDGRLIEEMKQLASNLGIRHQVHFLGLRRDIPALMKASVATVLASAQEGLPNCVMESMGVGTPVVGTNIRGTQDLLSSGCGLLVNVGNVEELAGAMAWMVDRPVEARAMGDRGQELIADYGLQHILNQYEALYTEALQESETLKIPLVA
jgi:glycosyltransferase involved in cell wall biosynthesis